MITVSASLDTAYARQCGHAYDGLPVPARDDSVPARLAVFAEFYDGTGLVVTNVDPTPVRLELTPVQAREFAAGLLEAAAEAEAGHQCAVPEGGCCGHAIRVAEGAA